MAGDAAWGYEVKLLGHSWRYKINGLWTPGSATALRWGYLVISLVLLLALMVVLLLLHSQGQQLPAADHL
jgi:hypothetical protein